MAGELEIQRAKKAEQLRALGIDPFGGRFDGVISAAEAVKNFAEAEKTGGETRARVAGRMMAMRAFGKLAFADLVDRSGKIQISFNKKVLGEKFDVVNLLDIGDIVGAEGTLFRTRTGEITVRADEVTVLAKSMLPPPEKWHGLTDVEARYRRRYVDLFANPEVRETFLKRGRIIDGARRFLSERGFVEVETPMMQPIYGGAAARPFVTHHNTLDIDLYLRIAPELYLKRLLVGGMERVFEINRNFRNEGISTRHNPEFTELEVYQAYADYTDMMEITEEMILELVRDISGGKTVLPFGEVEIDYKVPWRRATYAELLAEHAGVEAGDEKAVRAKAKTLGLEEKGKHVDVVTEGVFEATVEEHLIQPTFVMDYPASLCPLTKPKAGAEHIAERFEAYVAGFEIG
ncbi:MAG: lysine--tRNA ligase, partial [Planctomycetia bacterium]|nr:lysine--tRNA ligase [Planctomycetia bacterium]